MVCFRFGRTESLSETALVVLAVRHHALRATDNAMGIPKNAEELLQLAMDAEVLTDRQFQEVWAAVGSRMAAAGRSQKASRPRRAPYELPDRTPHEGRTVRLLLRPL